MPSGRRARVENGTPLLDAARQMGVEIESICSGRLTCGKCKVKIEEGHFQKHRIESHSEHLSQPSGEEMDMLASMDATDCRLSCSARVHGDVLVFVPEESRAKKQIIRKSATEREIEVLPSVRQLYVEVKKAELGEHRGDWGRLQDALKAEWNLENLSIDLPALQRLQPVLREGKWAVTATIWNDREVIDVAPGYVDSTYGMAVDIGSTTVAAYLCNLRTGELVATESAMNPQVVYGEDLMSRISYAMVNADGLDKMHEAIIDTLNRLAASAARAANIRRRDIHEIVFAGNTTMIHILLGINPVELGGAPFALANRDSMDVKARDMGLRLHAGANAHILPAEAGHVGADNVAVLIAEPPYRRPETVLTVDVGTNAEIVLGNSEWMYSASSPTGPAFEGAQIAYGMRAAPGAIERVRIDPETKVAKFKVIGEERWSDEWPVGRDVPVEEQSKQLASGICGSGIIEAVAEMYLQGIIRADGRFNPDFDSNLVRGDGRKAGYILARGDQTATGEVIVVTQDDVRNIQLAKAALYAGAKLLMNRAGVDSVGRVVLAGAFGSYIDPKYAMVLGLIPDCELENVVAVGNAAGDGARIALLNRQKRAEAQEISHSVRYIETAVDPEFQEEFVGAIHLPHASDAFPHLDGILPEQDLEAQLSQARNSRRPRRTRISTPEPVTA
ncbi:MAG: DUF4445 domain-containing protein [Caldilineales bacterium]|nr:DUF4445 domain-containing protein [Caldilineales bacterium]